MNHPPESHDPELSELLHSWRVESRDDPAFARKVWRRIEARPSSSASFQNVLEILSNLLARPAIAVAAVALFAVLGALTAEVASTARRGHDSTGSPPNMRRASIRFS
jgi:hypothetical protein